MLNIIFILVVSCVLIGFGILVAVLMCQLWGEEQGEANECPKIKPEKESPIAKVA